MAFEERSIATSLSAREPETTELLKSSRREDVAGRLFRKSYLFDFFQAVWLLDHALSPEPGDSETTAAAEERIRIRPHAGLAFPASDVRKIEWLDEENERVQVTVTFMGLYGVASPLPVYFYDAIATNEHAEPLRDFLDIFNRRLYKYFYQAWKKYKPVLHPVSSTQAGNARVFTCLAGMGTPGFAQSTQLTPLRLMSLAGLLSSGVRSAIGLQTVVSTLFDGLQVRVKENILRWVTVRERPSMGDGSMMLGNNALLGPKVRDASGKFRLVLGPLGLEQFRAFLPGGGAATLLSYLVQLYTTDQLDYDVELMLKTSDVPPMRLGGRQMLGIDAWLGRPSGEEISVVVQYP